MGILLRPIYCSSNCGPLCGFPVYHLFKKYLSANLSSPPGLPEFLAVKWNPRLRKTAGMCRNKPDRTSWIELSPKVCSAPGQNNSPLLISQPLEKVGRHTKSLDIVRKICGICKGRFTLQIRQNARKTTAKEGLEHNPFAKFVKENYGKHKKPGVKHGEVSFWLF
ncbi:hypothetical protein ANCDUO_12999 [Ancylostoma duodenale]|uniref:Uncharacterized protein n=1 Tax=Ancylostoma duodenale TaxID=51022 RepID=A0A0C2D439_9BILA|nr:hypothetical protein ANCDUO_12999 [Ancylostoma duodenale]